MHNVLILNLGSTSTKFAIYEDEVPVFAETIRHSNEELAPYPNARDQVDLRLKLVKGQLAAHSYPLKKITVICSRGGRIPPCKPGAIRVNKEMVDHIRYRSGTTHALNTRAVAIRAADEILKKPFDECTFIVAHIGRGTSIRLFRNGQNTDCVNDDCGGFSPERGGGLDAIPLIELCFSGKYQKEELLNMVKKSGGLKAHLGTSDAREIEVIPGELEMEALASGALRVLRGHEQIADFI